VSRRLEPLRLAAAAPRLFSFPAPKTFAFDPAAKVLVLTNARQAYKRIWGPEPYITSLGGHVWAQAGVEPFSIEQIAIDRPCSLARARPTQPRACTR
jgi:hypothetical protein